MASDFLFFPKVSLTKADFELMNKNEYVCSFLNHLNWQYINYEYLEAIKKLT